MMIGARLLSAKSRKCGICYTNYDTVLYSGMALSESGVNVGVLAVLVYNFIQCSGILPWDP